MKLRDCVFLLLLLDLPFSSTENDCNFWKGKGSEKTKIIYTTSIRIADLFTSWIPGSSSVLSGLQFALDLMDKKQTTDYNMIVNCQLNQYHRSLLLSNVQLQDRERSVAAKARNSQKLEEIRKQIENRNNMALVFNGEPNVQAAIYPLLINWATNHLLVYKELINLNRSNKYKEKHDEWAVYYVQLILRYWRPYRNTVLKENPLDLPDGLFENPAERLLANFTSIPYTSEAKNKISILFESCKVKKGNRVMFNHSFMYYPVFFHPYMPISGKWLSCWGSGPECIDRSCPSKHGYSSLFNYDKKFPHGIECRGEAFWIYSNNNEIMDEGIVNIKYSCCKGNKGYWVSTDENGYTNTRTCPGKTFTGIKSYCKNENIRINKMKTSSSQKVVYDGNLISKCSVKELMFPFNGKNYCSMNDLYEIYKDGSETLKSESVFPPTWEILSDIDEFKDQIVQLYVNSTNGHHIRFDSYEGSVYYFHKSQARISWKQAENKCKEMFLRKSELASIPSANVFNYFKSKIEEYKLGYMFVGGKRKTATSSEWIWLDGTSMDAELYNKKYWSNQQPDNYGGYENILMMFGNQGGGLNDYSDTTLNDASTFVCRIFI